MRLPPRAGGGPADRGVVFARRRLRAGRRGRVGAVHRLPRVDGQGPGLPSHRDRADDPRRSLPRPDRRAPPHVRQRVRARSTRLGRSRRRRPEARCSPSSSRSTDRGIDALAAMAGRTSTGWDGARSARCRTASSWRPGSSTPGPTSRTSGGPSAVRAAATGRASRSYSTGAPGPCPTWWASGWPARRHLGAVRRSPGRSVASARGRGATAGPRSSRRPERRAHRHPDHGPGGVLAARASAGWTPPGCWPPARSRWTGDMALGHRVLAVDVLHDLTAARSAAAAAGPTGLRNAAGPAASRGAGGRYTHLFVCERQLRPRRATRSVSRSRSTNRRSTKPSTT